MPKPPYVVGTFGSINFLVREGTRAGTGPLPGLRLSPPVTGGNVDEPSDTVDVMALAGRR